MSLPLITIEYLVRNASDLYQAKVRRAVALDADEVSRFLMFATPNELIADGFCEADVPMLLVFREQRLQDEIAKAADDEIAASMKIDGRQ